MKHSHWSLWRSASGTRWPTGGGFRAHPSERPDLWSASAVHFSDGSIYPPVSGALEYAAVSKLSCRVARLG